MGLGDYNRKRDFRVTAEPPGRPARSATGRSFVVQKHDATRLHYDFRLELDGVLKSWSVPKGPSFDPTIKRLAVAVEDHPIDYGGFEGIIPAGQYGGGTVLLWDRGTWSPLSDPTPSLAAGQLKFELSGEKLQGRWVLVKIKERGGRRSGRLGPEDRSWLLIKERDAHARPEGDWSVTEARPESVATGRDLGVIAADSDRVWHSVRDRPDPAGLSGARAAPLPESLRPARATRALAVPAGAGWVHEIELFGERVLGRIEGGRVRFFGAGGSDRSRALAGLARAAQALPAHQAIVDGVATAVDSSGQTDADRPADTLYVFDLLHLDGQDLTRVPLVDRKALLATLVASSGPAPGLRYTDHISGRGRDTLAQATHLGARGLVSKRASGRYPQGPRATDDWRVISCLTDPKQDVRANGKRGKRDGKVVTPLGRQAGKPAGKQAGKQAGKSVGKSAGKQAGKQAGNPAGNPAGKQAGKEVGKEVGKQAGNRGGAATHAQDVRVAGVRLTHPDRVLFPEVGLTKLDLAEFYQAVAPLMIPHVEDRPLTLVRAPDGVPGASFYVRHAGLWAPKELRQVKVPDGTGSGSTMIADNVAGLVALAQMNVLEIHTWNAQVSRIETPDRLVFDLDPGPKVTWTAVVEGALHVRAALRLLDLESFVKTTGSKGLHVVVPLLPAAGWKESLEFSRAMAQALARAEPSRYSAVLTKAGREDKIFIDYLRNRRGATSVCAYSTRARPSAPVSVPLSWDELGPTVRSDTFAVGSLPALLRERPDPWAGFAGVRQKLTPGRLRQAQSLLGRG